MKEDLSQKETECSVHAQDYNLLRSNFHSYSTILHGQIANLKRHINIFELQKQDLQNRVIQQAHQKYREADVTRDHAT